MTLEERISRLEDIEAIRQLQSRYQRCVDMHDFDELADCFTEDAESSYDSGVMSYQGRAAIVDFLRKSLTEKIKSSHLIHGGEIDIADSEHATGIWYLEDFLLHRSFFLKIHGSAIYHVNYRKEEGVWRISAIGYERNYEYFQFCSFLNILTLKNPKKLQKKFQ